HPPSVCTSPPPSPLKPLLPPFSFTITRWLCNKQHCWVRISGGSSSIEGNKRQSLGLTRQHP
ncbi:hypothetical protein Tsubulata_008558, partial [Turnera subulata]